MDPRPPSPSPAAARLPPALAKAPHDESGVALHAIDEELARIERHLRDIEAGLGAVLAGVHPEWRESARNLIHYAALRQLDLRELQLLLQQHGLSSLGRSESFVMASLLEVRVRAVEASMVRGQGRPEERAEIAGRLARALPWRMAEFLLHTHTHQVLGAKPEGRHVYAMVTAPEASEASRAWMSRMLRAGMNVLRINCAHEGPDEWTRILAGLDAARRDTGLDCRVLMDLAGPKIRIGPIAEEIRVATWKVGRDALGKVVAPATVVLRPVSGPGPPGEGPVLLLDDGWYAELRPRDVLRFRDTRGKQRRLTVRRVTRQEAVAETTQRAYVIEKTLLVHDRAGRPLRRGRARIAGASGAAVRLSAGALLVLTPRAVEGRGERRDARGRVTAPAVVSCTLPEALVHVEVGHRVMFDDGCVEGVVERVGRGDLRVRVRRTARPVVKLREDKGINLPDSRLAVPALGAEDRRHLAFVAGHADLVGLSFVRSPEDVKTLHDALDGLGRPEVGIVLKIETKAGFENLPRILLEAMRRPPLAVMIARGDLAVEMGYERLAEVQEEILWLCEASHVPAIWATQVLDTLTRTGVPSRAEVTDAAASVAAECVMLNKGAHVEDALRTLIDILRRMERHHYKKRSIFRRLHVSALPAPTPAGAHAG
jgi:pyruvate kinase